jgi:hypothetical protein
MEQQGDYITKEEIEEGLAMIGKGYEDQPSVVVEPPRRRIERRGKEMLEVEEAAFVKFSTEFKSELADLDVYALKVFIYIGLSINFESGTAYPGVRKIAKETGMNKDTVGKAIEELESKGFLQVRRKDGSSNIYKPECYFAIGETVPSGRTVPELSGAGVKLSDENGQLSGASRVKDAQLDKQESTRRGDLVDGYLDLAQSPGIKRMVRIDSILSYLGGKLKVNTETKRWKDFAKFVDDRQQAHHEPLDIFISWLTRQKNFDIQFWPPSKMQEMWPQAFMVIEPEQSTSYPRAHKL